MKNKLNRPVFGAMVFSFQLLSITFSSAQYEYTKEFSRTNEKEVRIKIASSFKKVLILKGSSDKIATIEYISDDDETPDVDIRYRVDGDIGIFKMDLNEDGTEEQLRSWTKKFHKSSGSENDVWYIKLSNEVPLRLNVDLGAGSGNIDISGLIIKELKLSTGASNTSIVCNEPNQVMMEVFTIEAGLSKFIGRKLGNANFKTLTFEGGVGLYSLDFSGALRREANVNVELGVGQMNILLPRQVGAQIRYDESFFSSHSFEDFREIGDGKFISTNFNNSDGRLSFKIESGLGSIKVKRVDNK